MCFADRHGNNSARESCPLPTTHKIEHVSKLLYVPEELRQGTAVKESICCIHFSHPFGCVNLEVSIWKCQFGSRPSRSRWLAKISFYYSLRTTAYNDGQKVHKTCLELGRGEQHVTVSFKRPSVDDSARNLTHATWGM